MAHETDLRANHFIEGSRPRITYTLKDAAGNTITTALLTQEASIYDAKSKEALPGWTDKDINGLEGNGVTAGVGSWDLPTTATVKLTKAEFEDHIIAMKGTYDTDKVFKHFILIRVYEQPVGG